MKLKLKDIIDLEYLVRMDDERDTQEEIQDCQIRDRDIYSRINGKGQDKKTLLINWLAHRKIQYLGGKDKNKFPALPGTLFLKLYRAMVYLVGGLGLFSGLSLVTSFLVYHGNQPVNVTLFIFVFILLPLLLLFFSTLLGFRKVISNQGAMGPSPFSGVHSFLSTLMFKGLPKLLQKFEWEVFKKSVDVIETSALIIKMKKKQYQGLFFWPFFILTSLFSICFSVGALAGTLFRVMVSDMAFGWQSTILTSSQTVHVIVSRMAWPWAGWMPVSIAYPSMEQIEGSRIILKDGISVLTTQDLVSWWPFLCMGIFFYAVLPRGISILTGLAAQNRALLGFDFNLPAFNDLIARMQSPCLSVETQETPVSRAIKENPIKRMDSVPQFLDESEGCGQSVIVLMSKQAYAKDAEKNVLQGIETGMLYKVKQTLGVCFNFDADEGVIKTIDPEKIDQVILVQEVWQPPIRGLLYYIKQLQAVLPNEMPVLVLLTNDAEQPELTVDRKDINFDIWKKAVFKLENSKIRVKRFIRNDS